MASGSERYRMVVALVAAAFIAFGALAYAGHVQSQVECLTDYAAANQQRSQILTRIAAEDRQVSKDAEANITRLITDAIAAQGDPGAGQDAADRYLQASRQIAGKRAALEQERAAHPFPETPERTCA